MDDNNTDKNNDKQSRDRHWVARIVLISSIGGLFILAILIICYSYNATGADDKKNVVPLQVFNTLLPVFGTWVGTLLAFYFSRENFEAAAKSVSDMANKITGGDERLKQIPARDKMRPVKEIISVTIVPGKEQDCKLTDLLSKFAKLDRIPMLDDKGCVVYLVYKNLINQFLGEIALGSKVVAAGTSAKDLTFKDLLGSGMTVKDQPIKDVFQKSFGLIAENATLADAKRLMETVAKTTPCNDVFVTHTGQSSEQIIGWITDNTIEENLKV